VEGVAAAYDAGGVVKVRGLQVSVPPKEVRGVAMPDDPKRRGQPRLGIAVDTIECTDAKVVIETNAPGKKPLEFAISRLVLTDVGQCSRLLMRRCW